MQMGIAVADSLFNVMAKSQSGVTALMWWLMPARVKFITSKAMNMPIE